MAKWLKYANNLITVKGKKGYIAMIRLLFLSLALVACSAAPVSDPEKSVQNNAGAVKRQVKPSSSTARDCANVCRQRGMQRDYKLAIKREQGKAAVAKIVPSQSIRSAVVPYEYLNDSQAKKLKLEWIRDQGKYCANQRQRLKESCLKDLEDLKEAFSGSKDWRHRLTEQSLLSTFSELGSQRIVFQDINYLNYVTIFKFTPHYAQANVVSYYSVECPVEKRTVKEAICTLTLNQAFYAEDPSEYFQIEKSSDINTAVWAFTAHKGIKVIPANAWMARWLRKPRRVSSIEVDGNVVKFLYHSGSCWHQVWYQIVADKKLAFLKTTGRFCI